MRKLKLFSREQVGNASDAGRQYSRPDSLSLVSRQSVLAFLLVLLTTIFGVGNVWGEEETVSIQDYATSQSWKNATPYPIITTSVDGLTITATSSGTNEVGKYYTSDQTWRNYGQDNKITIAYTKGTINTVKITYKTSNNGSLKYNGTQVKTDTETTIDASSAEFITYRTSGTKNPQVNPQTFVITYTPNSGSGSSNPTV